YEVAPLPPDYEGTTLPVEGLNVETAELLITPDPLAVDELPLPEAQPVLQTTPLEEQPNLDVLMPPPIAPSTVDTGEVEWEEPLAEESEPEPSYVTESPVQATDSVVMDRADSFAASGEESFTASSLWTEEPRFSAIDTPIDIEATEVTEPAGQPVTQAAGETE